MKNTTQQVISAVCMVGVVAGLYRFGLLGKAVEYGVYLLILAGVWFVVDCIVWNIRHRGQ